MKPLAILALSVCLSASAQARPKKKWLWSAVALVGASVADVHSSYGLPEANPLLRGRDGRLGMRGVGIKFGLTGGVLAAEALIRRKSPRYDSTLTVTNFAVAGGLGAVAARNYRLRAK